MLPIENLPGMGDYTNGQHTHYPHQQSNAQWAPAMNNAGSSFAMLPPENNQQYPNKLYTSAIQHQ
jgi:hypothetical protein